jgi:SPP1 gp7 family putative phage head morphogenesis protein
MNVVQEIKQKIRESKSRGVKYRLKKPGRILPPKHLEVAYQGKMRAVSRIMETILNQLLIPALPDIVAQADILRPNSADVVDGSSRFNAWADIVDQIIKMSRDRFSNELSPDDMEDMAHTQGQAVSYYNRVAVIRSVTQMVGFPVFINEPWLESEMKSFVHENVSLIKSIPEDLLSDVNETVNRMVRQGYRVEDIGDAIKERYGVSQSKANLIGRDQTNKFAGSLNMLRQKSLGLTRYVWHGVEDDRERESHLANEGQVYSWTAPPAETGNPGEDYQCRCWAEPYLDDDELGISDDDD